MELSSRTRVSELLTKYPFLKDFLINYDPHFKTLDAPFVAKSLGRIADMGKVSFMTGIKLDRLLPAIADEIKKTTGDTLAVRTGDGSESTGEKPERLEILKGIIRDLHKGGDRKALTERFNELIRDIAPWEIAAMEQQLMAEGMPQEEIKELCDVHVDVFRKSLERKTVPGLPAGHPVHTFMLENRVAEGILNEIESLHGGNGRMIELLDHLSQIDLHYIRKENQLFPALESKGISAPSKVMWALHNDIREMLKELRIRAQAGNIVSTELDNLAKAIREMIYKEEHIFFPMTLESLSEQDWGRVKQGEEEIGYAWIRPEADWQPASPGLIQELISEKIGSIALDTGLLDIDQINLILTHLPVDISFVNENDEVSYYSQTPDRVFPRSPGVIGRKVRNCHPPKSVGIVEKIIDAFKDGARDTEDFWIEMKGRFIYIRYFAVRDKEGRYRGTLEVSQDVTGIRRLQGQKRLLDWG